MAKETKETKAAAPAEEKVVDEIRKGNMMTDTAIMKAMEEIEKEKDEDKKREAKRELCIATYDNRKTRLTLRKRRAEDDLMKERLSGTQTLLERLIGFKTEIKDGILVPTKEKIEAKEMLTPAEHERELRKLREEIDKKQGEIDKEYRKDVDELRNSYEGQYRYYLNEW